MSIFNGKKQYKSIISCVLWFCIKGCFLYEIDTNYGTVPESVAVRLYEMYRDAYNEDNLLSRRSISTSGSRFDLHVEKLKEVNGFKAHNLHIKQYKEGNEFQYIANPIEAKIPNAFLTLDEFRNLLSNRAVAMRARFDENKNIVHQLPRPKTLRINLGYLSEGKVTPKLLVKAFYNQSPSSSTSPQLEAIRWSKKRKILRMATQRIKPSVGPKLINRHRVLKVGKRKVLRKKTSPTTEETTMKTARTVDKGKLKAALKFEIAEEIRSLKHKKWLEPILEKTTKTLTTTTETPADIAQGIIESKLLSDVPKFREQKVLGAQEILTHVENKYLPNQYIYTTEPHTTTTFKPFKSVQHKIEPILHESDTELVRHRFEVKNSGPGYKLADDIQGEQQDVYARFNTLSTAKEFTRYTPEKELLSQYIPNLGFRSTVKQQDTEETLSDFNPRVTKKPGFSIPTHQVSEDEDSGRPAPSYFKLRVEVTTQTEYTTPQKESLEHLLTTNSNTNLSYLREGGLGETTTAQYITEKPLPDSVLFNSDKIDGMFYQSTTSAESITSEKSTEKSTKLLYFNPELPYTMKVKNVRYRTKLTTMPAITRKRLSRPLVFSAY